MRQVSFLGQVYITKKLLLDSGKIVFFEWDIIFKIHLYLEGMFSTKLRATTSR